MKRFARNAWDKKISLVSAAICIAFGATCTSAVGAEMYRLRQYPVGVFGGEIAADPDNPGFLGSVIASHSVINKIAGEEGKDLALPSIRQTIPTGALSGGLIPDGAYSFVVAPGSLKFHQTQDQVNLIGGYVTETMYGGGRFAFVVNMPFIKQSRTVSGSYPLGTISPDFSAIPSVQLKSALTKAGVDANTQLAVRLSALLAAQNVDVSGLGDTELTAVYTRHEDRLKVVAGVSVFVPTGDYDKNRGPNPGFGNFYTIRPGIALTYSLNPDQTASSWDSGVTLAGRVSFGINGTNKDTEYRSGSFLFTEVAAVKVTGNWAFGANLSAIDQWTPDSGAGLIAGGATGLFTGGKFYRNHSIGPFISYKVPGTNAGVNLSYSKNFSSENALVVESVQVRLIRSW